MREGFIDGSLSYGGHGVRFHRVGIFFLFFKKTKSSVIDFFSFHSFVEEFSSMSLCDSILQVKFLFSISVM